MEYKIIKGDLISLSLKGEFDVIVHGVNCFCTQKSGLAPQMVKAFGTDKFPMEHINSKGNMNKLGQIDYQYYFMENGNISKGVVHLLNEKPDLTFNGLVFGGLKRRKPSTNTKLKLTKKRLLITFDPLKPNRCWQQYFIQNGRKNIIQHTKSNRNR